MTYPIPKAALDDRLGWFGIAGSGKTYNSSTAVEALLLMHRRVIIVDPLDVWWGLRLYPDGKTTASNVAIFGGAHGDLPLNEHAGALVGEAVATASQSCIVSLSDFPTKAAERRFMLAFLEALYRKASGEPVHLIFDEADLWAPQRTMGETAALQGKMEQLVRRGRVKGFIPWLISQRPAVLSKDVLSQMDGLVMFKLTSPHDRNAISEWVQGQADKEVWKDVWASMPTLQKGQGTIWIPARGILKTGEQFPEKSTYDSSRTPKRGESQRRVNLKSIDVGALKEKMASVEEEVKRSDPKQLRGEIARLRAELAKKPSIAGLVDSKLVEEAGKQGRKEGFAMGFLAGASKLRELANDVFGVALAKLNGELKPDKQASHYSSKVIQGLQEAVRHSRGENVGAVVHHVHVKRRPLSTVSAAESELNSAQARIADSLQFWRTIGHAAPTREQVAAVAGFKPRGGHFTNVLGSMRSSGMVDYPSGGRVQLLQEIGTPLTGGEARDRLMSVLNGAQTKIVKELRGTMSRDELSQAAGFTAGGGHFTNVLGSLRTIDVVRYPSGGMVELTEWALELLS